MRTAPGRIQNKPSQFMLSKPWVAATSSRPSRCFSTSIRSYAGLMPDTHDPQPPQNEPEEHIKQATEVSEEDYHEHADQYMERIHEKAEQMQESREDIEVEYSVSAPP